MPADGSLGEGITDKQKALPQNDFLNHKRQRLLISIVCICRQDFGGDIRAKEVIARIYRRDLREDIRAKEAIARIHSQDYRGGIRAKEAIARTHSQNFRGDIQ